MSRHRRQQRRRAGRARAELAARLALLEANWPSIVNSMFARAGVSQMRAGEALRNMNELQAEYGAEARERMRSIVEGVAILTADEYIALGVKHRTAAETLRTVNDVPGYPYGSSAVPIADALFGALGFRRVE